MIVADCSPSAARISLDDGEVLWQTRLADSGQVHAQPLLGEDRVWIGVDATSPGYLVVLDLDDGREVGRMTVPFGVAEVIGIDAITILVHGEGSLTAVATEKGTRVWDRRRVPSGVVPARPAARVGRFLYWLDSSRSLQRIDPRNGRVEARRSFSSAVTAGPAGEGDVVAVALEEGAIERLSRRELEPLDRFETEGMVVWLETGGGVIHAMEASSSGLAILVVSPDGSTRRRELAAGAPSTPRPLLRDGRLYLGTEEGALFCLDAVSLEILWGLELRQTPRSLAAHASGLLVGTREGLLLSIRTDR